MDGQWNDNGTELPSGQARDDLILAFGRVIRLCGFDAYARRPTLLPRAEHFPDHWDRSAAGAYRLVRRLLHYASLPGRARIHLFKATPMDIYVDGDGHPYPESELEGAIATFREDPDGTFVFGVEVCHLADDDMLTAALCHEVAHAFRHSRGVCVRTPAIEEQLTDITTIYLGFGVLATNAAYRHRTEGHMDGHENFWKSMTVRAGYLGASAMAFLLAVDFVVRPAASRSTKLRQEIAGALETNQAALFKRAVRELSEYRMSLRAQLGLPEDDGWPPPIDASHWLLPLDMSLASNFDARPPAVASARPRGPARVARVERSNVLWFVALGSSLSVVVFWFASSVASGILASASLVALSTILGKKTARDECSHCRASLLVSDRRCPSCGGSIRETYAARCPRAPRHSRPPLAGPLREPGPTWGTAGSRRARVACADAEYASSPSDKRSEARWLR